VTDVALGTFHESVDEPPGLIEEGDAPNDEPAAVGHAATVTVACKVIGEQPAAPLAVRV
jgi:hypothetical protein